MLNNLNTSWILVLIFFLISCRPTTNLVEVVPTEMVISHQSSTPTLIASTPPVTTTSTHTKVPSTTQIATMSTPMLSTVTETPTLMPTLTYEEKSNILTELMTINGGCTLPCWWGIVPGETNLDFVNEEFTSKGFAIWDEGKVLVGGVVYAIDVAFDIQNEVIQIIHVRGENINDVPTSDWNQYYLSSVLNHYSKPSRIQVFAPWRPDPGPLSYDLLLFYNDLGIVVEYIGMAEELDLETGRACPHSVPSSINLILYPPEQFSVDEVLQTAMPPQELQPIAPADVLYEWTSLELSTELTVEEFYQKFRDVDDQECFDFVSFWQQ